MPSPILALQGNIVFAFENPNGSAVALLQEVVGQGLLSEELVLEDDPSPPRAPRAIRRDGHPAEVVLHVAHLELVWAFVYGWIALYEEAVQRPMIAGTFDGRILLDSELKIRAAQLLDWASRLKDASTPWPEGLPSPNNYASEEERSFALKTNGIFQQSIAFCLFHEFAHVRQRHFDFLGGTAQAADPASILEMEREADDFAFRVIVSPEDDEVALTVKAWPILAAVLSSLYLVHGPAGVYQEHHPHLHHRVYEMLAKFDFRKPSPTRDYFHYLCATVLLVVSQAQGGRLEPEVFDTADDALGAEMDSLDEQVDALVASRRRS
jgi:hypothetical protein